MNILFQRLVLTGSVISGPSFVLCKNLVKKSLPLNLLVFNNDPFFLHFVWYHDYRTWKPINKTAVIRSLQLVDWRLRDNYHHIHKEKVWWCSFILKIRIKYHQVKQYVYANFFNNTFYENIMFSVNQDLLFPGLILFYVNNLY